MKATRICTAAILLLILAQTADAQRWGRRRTVRPMGTQLSTSSASTPQGRALIEFIKQKQHFYIGESTGEEAWQCVTWDDLQMFRADVASGGIPKEIKADKEFHVVAEGIGELTSSQRNVAYARARRTYKPTWAQIGGISARGQTVAGQIAERELAGLIVDLAQEYLTKTTN